MKITINRALLANDALQKRQLPGGQVQKPDILKAKGDAGMSVYFLKHAIMDACGVEFERVNDLWQDKYNLQKEIQELTNKKEENKTGLSKKDQNRVEELTKSIEEINDELIEIGEKEKELELKSGKIPISGIKNIVEVDILEALDFAIDFDK